MLWVVNRPPGVSAAADRPLLVVVAATSASKSSMPDQVHVKPLQGGATSFLRGGSRADSSCTGSRTCREVSVGNFGALGIIYGGVTPSAPLCNRYNSYR
jgi:hypothetical protein